MEESSKEGNQIQEAIRQSLTQIQELRERIKSDQEDIKQSRARTEAMLARLKAK